MKTKKLHIKAESFQAIAPRYDLINDLLTFGLHRFWKANLVKSSTRQSPALKDVLDLATGTGDNMNFLKSISNVSLVGLDPSKQMLKEAKRKFPKIKFKEGLAENLPFDKNTFDLITCTFGPRNFDHLQQGLSECFRVLKPGGVLGILETHPLPSKPLAVLFKVYWTTIVPLVGRLFGHGKAYKYLKSSTDEFLTKQKLAQALEEASFSVVEQRSLLPYGQVVKTIAVKK